MDAAVCGACGNEIKEMIVVEQDASHHPSACSLFSCID
jgi:hypothetical protein